LRLASSTGPSTLGRFDRDGECLVATPKRHSLPRPQRRKAASRSCATPRAERLSKCAAAVRRVGSTAIGDFHAPLHDPGPRYCNERGWRLPR
jgi:hypothetical protein